MSAVSFNSVVKPSLGSVLSRGLRVYKANQVGHVFNGPQRTSLGAGFGQVLSPDLYASYKAYQGLGEAKRWYHAPLMGLFPKQFTAFQMRKQLGNEGVGSWLAAAIAPDLSTISAAGKLRKLDTFA